VKKSPRYAEILKLAERPEGVVMSSSNGGSVLQKLLKSGEVIKLPSGDKQVPSRYFSSQAAADAFKAQPPEVKAKKQKKAKPWNVCVPVKPSEKKPKKIAEPKAKPVKNYSTCADDKRVKWHYVP